MTGGGPETRNRVCGGWGRGGCRHRDREQDEDKVWDKAGQRGPQHQSYMMDTDRGSRDGYQGGGT